MTVSPSNSGRLSIGEVLALLRPDFPDVTISKIRFLESEGLVEPARTPAGYRKFSYADVRRLHYVLSVQRDRYLPLRVIRERLDAIDRGLEPSDDRSGVPKVPPRSIAAAADIADAVTAPRLSRTELLANAGIDEDLLADLEGFGLVTQRNGYFDSAALSVAVVASGMAEFGLHPRHLRVYKTAADRAVSLIDQAVTPIARRRSDDAMERAAEAVDQLADLSVRLHACLIKDGLRRRR